MGYTKDSRPGIFAYRPAPIQASYLGFPGTMGAAFIDYIIADKTVAPFEHQPFYTEKIVHLPDCYLVNDTKRKIAERTPTRQEAGLPEKGFVFCCFNNNWKITPDVFDVWMRLLHSGRRQRVVAVGRQRGRRAEPAARRRERRGIDPIASGVCYPTAARRAPGAPPSGRSVPRHAALQRPHDRERRVVGGIARADLQGKAFAGRVAASLLYAVGLPELVTHSLEDYEALALRLAEDPSLLQGYRNRLATNRLTYPLFDTDRFRRHIEAAYMTMWELWQRGEQPRSFSVEPR